MNCNSFLGVTVSMLCRKERPKVRSLGSGTRFSVDSISWPQVPCLQNWRRDLTLCRFIGGKTEIMSVFYSLKDIIQRCGILCPLSKPDVLQAFLK